MLFHLQIRQSGIARAQFCACYRGEQGLVQLPQDVHGEARIGALDAEGFGTPSITVSSQASGVPSAQVLGLEAAVELQATILPLRTRRVTPATSLPAPPFAPVEVSTASAQVPECLSESASSGSGNRNAASTSVWHIGSVFSAMWLRSQRPAAPSGASRGTASR